MGSSGGGGTSTTTNTVDYEYNARMATIAEEQNDWARDYYDMWNTHFKPYEIAQVEANKSALPYESALYENQLKTANELLPQQTEATKKFLDMSINGVDVNERVSMAAADNAASWKGVQEATARENARMGVNPNSGKFQGVQAALGIEQAANLAGAKTQARVGAEQENYSRIAQASQYGSTNSVLQGVQLMKE